MRLGVLDTMIGLTYALASGVLGLGLVRLADVPPAAGMAAGGLLLLLCSDMHAASKAKRANARLTAELKALQADHETLKTEMAELREIALAAEPAPAVASAEETERERSLLTEMKVLEDLIRRVSEQGPELTAGPKPAEPAPRHDLLDTVRGALEDNRVDLYLQPVVSLPQRRVRYYESFTRLRDVTGDLIMPGEFLEVARRAGLMTAIDNLLLFRCVQIVRRLAEKERRVGVFCNVSIDSLADPDFFPQFMDFMRQNSDLADSLIFEIGQQNFEGRSLEAARGVARLVDFGFRFSIDHVRSLDVDFAEMQRAGVKFFKAPGRLLVETLGGGAAVGGIAAEDYAAHLARYGIELIVEKVEDEGTVVEALEFDVALGQGHLFGEPRPIRDQIIEAPAAPLRAAG